MLLNKEIERSCYLTKKLVTLWIFVFLSLSFNIILSFDYIQPESLFPYSFSPFCTYGIFNRIHFVSQYPARKPISQWLFAFPYRGNFHSYNHLSTSCQKFCHQWSCGWEQWHKSFRNKSRNLFSKVGWGYRSQVFSPVQSTWGKLSLLFVIKEDVKFLVSCLWVIRFFSSSVLESTETTCFLDWHQSKKWILTWSAKLGFGLTISRVGNPEKSTIYSYEQSWNS